MKRLLFFIIIFSLETLYATINFNLMQADTKLLFYVPSHVLYYFYENIPQNIYIDDLNADGYNDLCFIKNDYSFGFYYACADNILIFYGDNNWADSIIAVPDADVFIALPGSSFFEIPTPPVTLPYLGKCFIAMVRNKYIHFLPPGIHNYYAIIPTNISPGTHRYEELDKVIINNNILLPPSYIYFYICASGVVKYGTFLIFPRTNEFSATRIPLTELFFVPITKFCCFDTINLDTIVSFKIYIDSTYEPFLGIPGDLNNNGFEDILVGNWNDFGKEFLSGFVPNPRVSGLYRTSGYYSKSSHIIFGHSRISTISDTITPTSHTAFWNSYYSKRRYIKVPTGYCDLDNDGFSDAIFSHYTIIDSSTTTFDTSTLYIIFGRSDFPRNIFDSLENVADIKIKSNFPNDGSANFLSLGDYNGDGYQDILIASDEFKSNNVGYLFLGNASRIYPNYFNEADIVFKFDSLYGYFRSRTIYKTLRATGCTMGDLNDDGLDEIVLAYTLLTKYDSSGYFPLVYIFFNRRPTPLLFHPDTNIIDNPHDSICIKLSFKQPLALHTLLLTVSGDTFTIDSPQVRFSPAESLLCFIPDTEWDASAIIPFCIERLEDTIGTAMRERWCVRFNDSTWIVNQPPKPHTLSLVCYPNPFNAEVRIKLRMPDAGDAKIDIYDISGKLIHYIHKTKLTAGWHELVWRPNVSVPSGVYLLRVSVGGEAVVRRVVLVR